MTPLIVPRVQKIVLRYQQNNIRRCYTDKYPFHYKNVALPIDTHFTSTKNLRPCGQAKNEYIRDVDVVY